ncbi:MAG: putative metal-binding motif-containing protein [Pseudomonadota bacterium]
MRKEKTYRTLLNFISSLFFIILIIGLVGCTSSNKGDSFLSEKTNESSLAVQTLTEVNSIVKILNIDDAQDIGDLLIHVEDLESNILVEQTSFDLSLVGEEFIGSANFELEPLAEVNIIATVELDGESFEISQAFTVPETSPAQGPEFVFYKGIEGTNDPSNFTTAYSYSANDNNLQSFSAYIWEDGEAIIFPSNDWNSTLIYYVDGIATGEESSSDLQYDFELVEGASTYAHTVIVTNGETVIKIEAENDYTYQTELIYTELDVTIDDHTIAFQNSQVTEEGKVVTASFNLISSLITDNIKDISEVSFQVITYVLTDDQQGSYIVEDEDITTQTGDNVFTNLTITIPDGIDDAIIEHRAFAYAADASQASNNIFSYFYDLDGNNNGDVDNDLDGFLLADDCNDSDALIFPGATEICDDFVDNDCDGDIDDDDNDCVVIAENVSISLSLSDQNGDPIEEGSNMRVRIAGVGDLGILATETTDVDGKIYFEIIRTQLVNLINNGNDLRTLYIDQPTTYVDETVMEMIPVAQNGQTMSLAVLLAGLNAGSINDLSLETTIEAVNIVSSEFTLNITMTDAYGDFHTENTEFELLSNYSYYNTGTVDVSGSFSFIVNRNDFIDMISADKILTIRHTEDKATHAEGTILTYLSQSIPKASLISSIETGIIDSLNLGKTIAQAFENSNSMNLSFYLQTSQGEQIEANHSIQVMVNLNGTWYSLGLGKTDYDGMITFKRSTSNVVSYLENSPILLLRYVEDNSISTGGTLAYFLQENGNQTPVANITMGINGGWINDLEGLVTIDQI